MNRALVVGINHYDKNPLAGCVNDAIGMNDILEAHGNGSPNFDVMRFTSDRDKITTNALHNSIIRLFDGAADIALLYFAGHGIFDEKTGHGYLCTQDGARPSYGVSLKDILKLANEAYPRIKSSVILLDCCQAGAAGDASGFGGGETASILGSGVTIMTACQKNESADEIAGQGVFTRLLIDALRGSAADILGRITPASVYAHIDQTLGAWEQRPIYKANVQSFVVLRKVPAKVPAEILRKLPTWFPSQADVFPLDPTCEPNRGEFTEKYKNVDIDPVRAATFAELQLCNRHSLIEPVDQPHMWHAAIHGTGCRLTALGAHYRRLAAHKRITE